MCCCGVEHDNDPKYKRANCFAGLNLAGEVIFMATLCWTFLAGIAALIWLCMLHGYFSGSSSSSSSSRCSSVSGSCILSLTESTSSS